MSTSKQSATNSGKETVLSVSKGKETTQNQPEANPQQLAQIREEERKKLLEEMAKEQPQKQERTFEEIQADFEILKRKMSQREAIKEYLGNLAKVVIDPRQTNCQMIIHLEGEEVFTTQNPQFLTMVKDSAKSILENRLKEIELEIRKAA